MSEAGGTFLEQLVLVRAFLIIPLCILVGIWNYNRGNSFWVGLLLALLLTMVSGAIIPLLTSLSSSAGGTFTSDADVVGVIQLVAPFIAGAIVAITPKNHEKLEKRKMASGKMVKCPSCAELIRADAMKCRYCGTPISQKPTQGV